MTTSYHGIPLMVHFPGKLVFGNGVFQQLAEELISCRPSRIFIITIAPLYERVMHLKEQLIKVGIVVRIDITVVAEPTFEDFGSLMREVEPFDPDLVIGIGGGSVLDLAKLIAAHIGNAGQLADHVGIGLLKQRSRQLVCVPATSGTGSEVSPNAILIDGADGQKKGIISPFLVPDIVYVDPELTHTVPPDITAATGMDALTHCLEAYANRYAQPFTDIFALEGIRLIAGHIVDAVRNGNDAHARAQVALGSLYGGFCLGPVNTAAVHALSYPLGSMYHLPHGLSNALLLPWVMEFNISGIPDRYAEVAVALGCRRGEDDISTARAGVQMVRSLNSACGIPDSLRAVGVREESFAQMAIEAMKIQRLLKNNPREITEADAVNIYENAY
jgi:alcohol dehydrogenase class IV